MQVSLLKLEKEEDLLLFPNKNSINLFKYICKVRYSLTEIVVYN